MTTKKDETASFVLRFNQKIYKDEKGESNVQWRGNIRHVQEGDEKNFAEFGDAINFIQLKLKELTSQAIEDEAPEEQEGILSKSFDIWKKMAVNYPKQLLETIKDPKGQIENIQNQVTEAISHNIDPDNWKPATKSDFKSLKKTIDDLKSDIDNLSQLISKK